MEPIQTQMVFCTAEQWMGGYFHRVEPRGDGLCLDPARASTGVTLTLRCRVLGALRSP